MRIQIISLFPEMFPSTLEQSMLYKAKQKNLVEYKYVDLREYGIGPRKQVDDTVYGGGDGMLFKPEPVIEAIESCKKNAPQARVILMTPRGDKFQQSKAKGLALKKDLIFVCARYEGYDERITEYVDDQISIGDYVLTGGELPAMIVIDSVVRLIPGVLGGQNSVENESFWDGKTKEHPHYTKPEIYRGMSVPDVLLSGNHQNIENWRNKHKKDS